MTIIIFIIILTILVFVHELGHFITAKKAGIRVDEFGIGFPPRLFARKRGETEYSLNLIPFGGFVKIFGENPDDESLKGPDSKRSFVNKNRAIQALVLIAGILFNIIFAWLVIILAFMVGMPSSSADYAQYDLKNERVIVVSVTPDSPAAQAGLRGGDTLLSVSSPKGKVEGEHASIEAIQALIAQSTSTPVSFEYRRADELKKVEITPQTGVVPDRVVVGIAMEKMGELSLPPHLAVVEGTKFTGRIISMTAVGLTELISKAFVGKANLDAVSGPVGIVGYVGDAQALGFGALLVFAAVISVNLALINLVPFPALDGGRLLFVGIEAIIRRPINPKIANTVNTVGFILLILLMILITVRDVSKL